MTRFLILQADHSGGRGARGLNLYRFLRLFHGRRAVRMMSTRELSASAPVTTDVLFIGVPTSLGKRHLARVKYRQAVLFDYQDGPGPRWLESDEPLLRSLTDQYLKPWVEPTWDYGLRMGVLPIRRHFKLKACVCGRQVFLRWAGSRHDRRIHDVAFVGEATALEERVPQRIDWLREIKSAGDRYSFWGGLVPRPKQRELLAEQFPDLPQLCYARGRVDYLTYFLHLALARVALAPAGNARWSYRHYEAIYAGSILVSADFRRTKTLIPLPLETMVHVPDGGSVLPAVDAALAMRERSPEIAQENIRFLERYLQQGDYCRRKPELMDRFLAQLAG